MLLAVYTWIVSRNMISANEQAVRKVMIPLHSGYIRLDQHVSATVVASHTITEHGVGTTTSVHFRFPFLTYAVKIYNPDEGEWQISVEVPRLTNNVA